ncbi:MAG: TIGR00288 family NYN domain-containing protein [archaeon]
MDSLNDLFKQAKSMDIRNIRKYLHPYIKEFIRQEKTRPKNVGLLIDGPNIVRKEFSVDFDEIRKKAQKYGDLKIAKAFLNQYAKEKLIEAIANQGFEPVMSISEDVDVDVAVEAVELIHNPLIDIIIIASRDSDYLPVFRLAKEKNKTIIVFGAEPGFSQALKNAADKYEVLGKRKFI